MAVLGGGGSYERGTPVLAGAEMLVEGGGGGFVRGDNDVRPYSGRLPLKTSPLTEHDGLEHREDTTHRGTSHR